MRPLLTLALALLATTPALAQNTTLPLWPGTPPGAPKVPSHQPEADTTRPTDDLVAGKPVIRLGNVSTPTLTLYRPTQPSTTPGPAIVVLPGGGYRILAMDLEGTEVCSWLTARGITCALVKYRVPDAGPYPAHTQDLADAQRAVRLVRAHASEWHIDPNHVGVLGFSAGGHLAAVLSNHADDPAYTASDAGGAVDGNSGAVYGNVDHLSARPNFTLLIYPAYLVSGPGSLTLTPEVQPTAQTPPTFLVQAEDDPIPVEDSLAYYAALKQVHVPAEMHLYAAGGHGYGLRPTPLPVTHWPDLADRWFQALGILPAPSK